jgi:Glycosyltransferase family 87
VLAGRSGVGGSSVRLALVAWQALFVVLLLARALTAPIDYDEDQYVAAGVLAQQFRVYRDFIYLQPPADPWLLAAVFRLIGGYYFLLARLLTFVLAASAFGLTIGLLRRCGAGRLLATLLATIALLSPFLDRPIATTRNDILPLALFLGALLCYLRIPARGWHWPMAAGLLAGLAVEAKISYVFAPVAFLLHAAWPGIGGARRAIALSAGIAIAALPGLYYLLQSPENFLFDLLEFHRTAPLTWYQRQDEAAILGPFYRLLVLLFLLCRYANASLLLLIVGGILLRRHAGASAAAAPIGLLILLLGLAAFVGFQPSPSWPMYYAPLAPLLAALAATYLASLPPSRQLLAPAPILAAIAAVLALPALVQRLADLPVLARPAAWPGLIVHREAAAIHDAVAGAGLTGDVATLFPLRVLDANSIPAAFASGPFFFRTADLVSNAKVAELHGASASSLEAQFAASPPAAILGGLAAGQWPVEMDQSLRDYARRHGYRPVPLDIPDPWPGGSWLYLREAGDQ